MDATPPRDSGRMDVHELAISTDAPADNVTATATTNERDRAGSNSSGTRRVTISRQNSSSGSRYSHTARVKKTRPDSGSSSATSTRTFEPRGSVLSRLSSVGGAGGLRDTFFGTKRDDPLELSTSQEFDLTVIDESGGMEPNVVGQILLPDVGSCGSWTPAGYAVTAIGVVTVVVTAALAVVTETLDGYSIDPGLVFGSLQTLVLCAIVFVTYHGVQSFQAHPNPLILYKCVIDMVLALRFLLDPLLQDWHVYTPFVRHSCKYLSAATQFLYIASDSWYFALIVDLYTSLTNPFTSVANDRRAYKIVIYSASTVLAVLTAAVSKAHGFSDGAYCWTHRGNSQERDFFRLNIASWLLFYDWMILFYLSGIAVLIFCAKRLRSGLRDTLETRRDMLRNGTISILSFTVYWTIVFIWYAVSFHTRTTYRDDEHKTMAPSHIFRSFTYSLSGRGAVDYFVWFMLNRPSQLRKQWLVFSAESADKKFSAQLNTALQHELIYFTIEGMTRAIQMADDELLVERDQSPHRHVGSEAADFHGGASTDSPEVERPSGTSLYDSPSTASDKKRRKTAPKGDTFDIPRVPPSAATTGAKQPPMMKSSTPVPSPRKTSSSSSSSYNHIRFTPYRPDVFAELRSAFGIRAADFLASFETSTKPNISEGASGAFLFFSGDRKFLVKSMAEAECRFLCEIADEYTEYLIAHPESLITKFYGCFRITLYEKKFYFVVMENLFASGGVDQAVHHRFDIKGSWVHRSYKRPRRGVKVKCRHCSMQFKYGAKKALMQCPNVVGLHEPNVVLKDNDLRTRMRIGRDAGRELYELLREDSLFLCRLGIMDYSLLLGVVDIEFMVDHEPHARRRNTVSSTSVDGDNTSFMTVDSVVGDDEHNDGHRDASVPTTVGRSGSHDTSDGSNHPMARSTYSATPAVDGVEHRLHATSSAHHRRANKSLRRSKRIFGPGFYYIGIIDILQTWTLQKRLERFFKVWIQRRDPDGLSAIEPEAYQRRFEAKLREIIALPKDYVAMITRRHTYPSLHSLHMRSASSGVAVRAAPAAVSVPAPGRGNPVSAAAAADASAGTRGGGTKLAPSTAAATTTTTTHRRPIEYDDNEVDIDVLIETGGRSGRGGAVRTASGAVRGPRHVDSDDIESSNTSHTSSSNDDLEDLEQAQRNPEPILLRFSHMLVGSSTRSNITTTSSQRDAV